MRKLFLLAITLIGVLGSTGTVYAWHNDATGVQPRVGYTTPSTNTDGSALTNLAQICLYWNVNGGAETKICIPASTAGTVVDLSDMRPINAPILPGQSGTINVQATAVNAVGVESARTGVTSLLVTNNFGAPVITPNVPSNLLIN